ncbi:unnamed protein product [Rodentolepis nana]|uniref:Tetraspanin n=1 Tax=Rodentolepis nana TaxID=102285 RepID=A0A0R3TA62_RODNA|nr:unnamed protein product [Rodentolepis nana]VDO06197.1 unnamed protein product [Rodentolepis nana]
MRHRYLARYYRGVILSFSSIIAVLSLVLCIYGGYIAYRANVEEIKTKVYLNPATTLFMGIIILIIGLIGLFGAWVKQKWACLTFAASLTVMVLAEAIVGGLRSHIPRNHHGFLEIWNLSCWDDLHSVLPCAGRHHISRTARKN